MAFENIDVLYSMDFDIKEIFAMVQEWKDKSTFEMKAPRNNSAFLYVEQGVIEYEIDGHGLVTAESGSTVYIPKGSVYTSRFNAKEGNKAVTLLCQFESLDDKKAPFVFFDKITVLNVYGIKDEFYRLINAYLMPNRSPSLLKAATFGIINMAFMCAKNMSLKKSSEFSSIRKGILYLENDPIQDKSISEIAAMCNVCESSFRRLFKLYSGQTPNEYRINKLIIRASKLLEAGNMSVDEIAFTLGFTDSAYFCRFFKKRTGVSPGKFNKNK